MSFKTVNRISMHMKQTHGKILQYFCARCDEVFSANYDLAKHIRIVHENQKPIQCEQCDKKFLMAGQLKEHVNNIHLKIRHIVLLAK